MLEISLRICPNQWWIYIVKFWTRAPLGVQILSISCSFWENLAKSYVGAPPGELAPPPRGNPGSATANYWIKWLVLCIVGDVYEQITIVKKNVCEDDWTVELEINVRNVLIKRFWKQQGKGKHKKVHLNLDNDLRMKEVWKTYFYAQMEGINLQLI